MDKHLLIIFLKYSRLISAHSDNERDVFLDNIFMFNFWYVKNIVNNK